MDYIPRAAENLVKQTARTFKAVLVTGARQIGKSTLLGHTHPNRPQVTFDDTLLRAQAEQDPALFLMNHPAPVLYDEVQRAPEVFPYIKMACDTSDERGSFLLTGSQPLRLMEKVSESLAGRIGIVELTGLSLREIQGIGLNRHFIPSPAYIEARKGENAPIDDIWTVIHRGSYPEMQNPEVLWDTFYSSYVQTYLERDVNEIVKVQNRTRFIMFLRAMAARTGQMLNYDNVADEVGISAPTVREWTSVLEASGIVLILQPFSSNALNRAIKTPKIFFRDTGLACYLTGWSSARTARDGAMAGALFETFVVNEIVKSFANEGIDWRLRLSYYRGRDKKRKDGKTKEDEIDLVINEDGTLYPVEVKLSANPRLDMTDAFDVLDKVPDEKRGTGAIVCMYPDGMFLTRDVFIFPVSWL